MFRAYLQGIETQMVVQMLVDDVLRFRAYLQGIET